MPNKRGKMKVRQKTVESVRKGMSEKEDGEVGFRRERCRWAGDVNMWAN